MNRDKKTYYISENGSDCSDGMSPGNAWSLSALISKGGAIEAGSAVLFQRGSLFRLSDDLKLYSHTYYGAYGTGADPVLCGSAQNYASAGWKAGGRKNIWQIPLQAKNAGIIVFDGGVLFGCRKINLSDVIRTGDFYHDVSAGIFYLCCPSDPSSAFRDIEIGTCFDLLAAYQVTDVQVNHLTLKYCGRHGIASAYSDHITVTDCEIGWIGGSSDGNGVTRLGNGIEFYGSAGDITVKNCRLYQIYDAGLTFQVSGVGKFENITFSDNLIEYCSYSIEFFNCDTHGTDETEKHETGVYRNISIENNTLKYAGYGWGSAARQREWWVAVAHLTGWKDGVADTTDFKIRNNVFYCSLGNLVYWNYYYGQTQPGLVVSGNRFYQKKTPGYAKDTEIFRALYQDAAIDFGPIASPNSDESVHRATDQQSLEKAVAVFDRFPAHVEWLPDNSVKKM